MNHSRTAKPSTTDADHDIVPRLLQQGYAPDHVRQRREWVEARTNSKLRHIGDCAKNILCATGLLSLPVGEHFLDESVEYA